MANNFILSKLARLLNVDSTGTPMLSKQIQSLTASVSSNAMTITLNPTQLEFRSATANSGAPNMRVVASAISITIPSGATLGISNGRLSRVMVYAIDNAGTVELGVCGNVGGSLPSDESGFISTVAISPLASIGTNVYSVTARSNVPYRIVGYVESTQTTAGTWSVAPSLVQGIGGGSQLQVGVFGNGNYGSGIGTKSLGSTYFNATGRPMFLHVRAVTTSATASSLSLTVSDGAGSASLTSSTVTVSGSGITITGFVPPYTSYTVALSGAANLTEWLEYR
jgi:hypothetical protein